MNDEIANQIPNSAQGLAQWFRLGVDEEIKALEKNGGVQKYEVINGEQVSGPKDGRAIYHFVVAGGARLPEDSSGQLKIGETLLQATVVSQMGNMIDIQVESANTLPKRIPRAILQIDDTALLRKLSEALEESAVEGITNRSLVTKVFHPAQAEVSSGDIETTGPDDKKELIQRALGSEVTYIWGPPGTGKTFSISHIIASAYRAGERVLVTSHTHAAVDQALYETIESDNGKGPLKGDPAISEGKIVRVGGARDKKIPQEVQLEYIVEQRAKSLTDEILEHEKHIKESRERASKLQEQTKEWELLAKYENDIQAMRDAYEEQRATYNQTQQKMKDIRSGESERQAALAKAQRAWFGREAKTAKAQAAITETKSLLEETAAEQKKRSQTMDKLVKDGQRLAASLAKQKQICAELPKLEDLSSENGKVESEIEKLQQAITEIQDKINGLKQQVLSEAKIVFATLTKCYVGDELKRQTFDAVIIDEISMALPPLVLLAALRAQKRAVLVGDFLQLSPIVRSDSEVSDERLRKDAFQMSGVATPDLKLTSDESVRRVVYKLDYQHRMLPKIADVARHLLYEQAGGLHDHPDVRNRKPTAWLDFLPDNPLVIVDTADLHCWCGREPGSLSRFNTYSANLSVEIAGMAAMRITEPPEHESTPIGIVTPFAAQRRLLAKITEDLGLSPWVTVGTVHTFQGGQAELIIMDVVLDEPYWTARLTNPRNDMKDVLRDLNVAVTRAQNKFVLLGSSEWLHKHAKASSALGYLWAYMIEHAELISAAELVEHGFLTRVIERQTSGSETWLVPVDKEDNAKHVILDENGFQEQFAKDLSKAKSSIVGLIPFFGEYRWAQVQPLFLAALERGVEVTLITTPAHDAHNEDYVRKAIQNLRQHGAIVVPAEGLHGKDIVIDERIHYTGSLNWASHRGTSEIMHRTESSRFAKQVLHFLQAKHIQATARGNDGLPRTCPECGGPVRIVNARQMRPWDYQPMKMGCANYKETGCKYLRDIDERPPLKEPLRCKVDKRTKFRRSKRGRGEVWQCPKHPRQCGTEKVVPGDPSRL